MHPYNDPRVIVGQGTYAREFIEQTDGLDIVMAPLDCGGMISGICLTLAHGAQIIAVEALQADDACRSFMAGYIIADDVRETVAGSLCKMLRASVIG